MQLRARAEPELRLPLGQPRCTARHPSLAHLLPCACASPPSSGAPASGTSISAGGKPPASLPPSSSFLFCGLAGDGGSAMCAPAAAAGLPRRRANLRPRPARQICGNGPAGAPCQAGGRGRRRAGRGGVRRRPARTQASAPGGATHQQARTCWMVSKQRAQGTSSRQEEKF